MGQGFGGFAHMQYVGSSKMLFKMCCAMEVGLGFSGSASNSKSLYLLRIGTGSSEINCS